MQPVCPKMFGSAQISRERRWERIVTRAAGLRQSKDIEKMFERHKSFVGGDVGMQA